MDRLYYLVLDGPEGETAIHEAGHVLAGLSFGWTLLSADIVPDSCGLGHTEFDGHGGPNCGDPPLDVATYVLAGDLALEFVRGGDGAGDAVDRVFGPHDDYDDAFAAWRQACEVVPDDPEYLADDELANAVMVDFIEQAVTRAEVIIRNRQGDLTRIAAALRKRGRLTPSTLEAVLSPHSQPQVSKGDEPKVPGSDSYRIDAHVKCFVSP